MVSTPLWRASRNGIANATELDAVNALGDLNGDGYDDLGIYDATADRTTVVHGGPSGASEFVVTPVRRVAAIGDFDGDGFDDVMGLDGVFLGSSDGISGFPRWSGTPGPRFGVAVGDVNGDGLDDFAGWDFATNRIEIWLGRGTGGDRDGDGVIDAADCDPLRVDIAPGLAEIAGNQTDEDCDGRWACFVDGDRDGYRGPVDALRAAPCAESELSAAAAVDCDDANARLNAGASVILGNAVDEDCDGQLEFECPADVDRDGFVASVGGVMRFDGPGCPTVLGSGDCNDRDALTYPGAPEVGPGAPDRNCDRSRLCYADRDGDGYPGLETEVAAVCRVGRTDCDDADAAVRPFAVEVVGNDADEDCNGQYLCLADPDADGWSLAMHFQTPCSTLPAVTPTANDCNPWDPRVSPGAAEIPGNVVDEDCDGFREHYLDADGDGFGSQETFQCDQQSCFINDSFAGDCDDQDPRVGPGLPDEPGDAVDADCDGQDPFHLDVGPESLPVRGVPARSRWWLAVSRVGPGPCVTVAEGICVDLIAPTPIAEGRGDATGARVRVPAGTTGYAQALALVDGVVWRSAVVEVGAP